MPEAKIEQRLASLATKRRPVAAAAVLFSLGICLILVALTAGSIYAARQSKLAAATVETTNMAQALAVHAETSFKLADAILEDVTERIGNDGLGATAAERLRKHLISTVAHVPELHALFVYGPDGRWLVTSLPYIATGNNYDREYFAFHRTHRDLRTRVGTPVRSRSTGVWIIPVSRRLENADGSFAGVALATLRVDFFQQSYERLNIGPQGVMFLALDNGTMVLRRPGGVQFIGTDVSKGPIFQLYRAKGNAGTAMLRSPIDGVERLYSFRHLEHFPLLVASAESKDDILADWRKSSAEKLAVMFALIVVLAWAGWRITRQIVIRDRLEDELRRATQSLAQRNRDLAELAASDGLTGLANRRRFEEKLAREFRRIGRAGGMLAVIMFDVDYFKRYNDHYGHLAGDDCLRMVAQAIRTGANRPADLAVRYGGEEFIVLLPETDLAGAAAVAERIREQVASLGIPHQASQGGIVTVSAGVFSGTPGDCSQDPLDFVESADRALYEAKETGRNKVVARSALPG
jgi:diguanylate cyclase (GGDEF)-like protein